MVVLYVLCGALAGFGAYRFGAARATSRRLNDVKGSVPALRRTAWRHTGAGALLIGGAILVLYLAGRLGGL
jgi:hypothetical protein